MIRPSEFRNYVAEEKLEDCEEVFSLWDWWSEETFHNQELSIDSLFGEGIEVPNDWKIRFLEAAGRLPRRKRFLIFEYEDEC